MGSGASRQERGQALARAAARRLFDLAVVMVGVATVVFLLLRAVPGDPVLILGGLDTLDRDVIARARAEMGLDRSLVEQYLIWLGNMVSGDLGRSLRSGVPVTDLILRAMPPTFQLGIMALVIGMVISVPLGVAAARRAGSPADLGITVFAILGISTPPFVIALGLVYLFAVEFRLLPVAGYVAFADDPAGNLRAMAMPALTLGLVTGGVLVRMMRRSVIDELGEDYVRTARAKGVGETAVVYRHAVRNAAIPYVTILGLEAGVMLSGAVITETIFAIPGLGRLMIDNINARDYPVVQGTVLVVALVYVLINAGVDGMYRLLDPRVRAGAAR
ncbi:MAG: ABC transporter permease [Rhodobacteraceae bacterium]|nr:ABC transporter permease [Paracoccaceae bacterium]